MTVTYTTSDKVAEYLQRTDFSASTIPSNTVVETYINRAESEIERVTGTAYRAVTVTDEIHRLRHKSRRHRPLRPPFVQLDFRPVRTFVSGTDYMYVWNGSEDIEWISTKTEGRASDYWVDYQEGTVNLMRGYPVVNWEDNVKFTYRYGHSSVPGWVEELATMMAALKVLQTDSGVTISNEGGGSDSVQLSTQDSRINNLNSEIERRLDEAKVTTRERKYTIL